MLFINEELPIEDDEDLAVFKSLLTLEIYDDKSEDFVKVYSKYVDEIYEIDKKVTQIVAEKINPHIIPIVSVNTNELHQFNELTFSALSTQEGLELTCLEKATLKGIYEEAYKSSQSLLERINQIS